MRRLRLLLPVVTLLAGIAVGWFLRHPPAAEDVRPAEPPAIGLRETNIVLRHKGVKQAEVQAEHVEVSRDLRYAVFRQIAQVVLYDKGRISLRLSSDDIILDRHTNDFVARGRVEITSPQGDRLVAPEAHWINAKQQMAFPKGVRMKLGDNEVEAPRLIVDTGLQIFDLEGGVDVTFHLRGTSR